MVFLVCIIVGIVTAFVGSLLGLGGGIIFIPSMLFLYQSFDIFYWANPQMIVGISLIAMIFTAMSSTITYSKKGRVDFRTGTLLLFGSIPGGVFGSWLNQFIDVDQFTLYFGLLIISLSLLMFVKRRPSQTEGLLIRNHRRVRTFAIEGETYHYTVSIPLAFFISLLVGTLSGMFGIGGGSIIVPAMILLFTIPPHIATATSMFMILITSLFGSMTHIFLGHIVWEYALFFIPGAWIGGTIGAKVNQLLKGRILEWLLRILLILIGLSLIFEFLS